MHRRRTLTLVSLTLAIFALGSCRSAYYGAMESLGWPKREILVDRVAEAREAQAQAREQFRDALEEFSALVGFEGGELEERYETLRDEYGDSLDRAETVSERIDAVQSVAEALFSEWEEELDRYANPELARQSARQLEASKDRYRELMAAMRRAEERMQPVLIAFRDQVLFLKHNLNARAVASLEEEVASLEDEIAALIASMEEAIAEADAFIEAMAGEGEG